MKRLCFDTESNYFMPPTCSGNVEGYQEYWRHRALRFDCAVVFDQETDEYREFTRENVSDLVAMLKTADELISHSAPYVDLIVLEHACGEAAVAPLRQIKHHDIREMGNWSSVATLAKRYAPDRVAGWEADYESRLTKAAALGEESFIAGKLAKARFDVERTYAVFLELHRRSA